MLKLSKLFKNYSIVDAVSLHGFVKKAERKILQNSSRQGLRPLPTGIVGKGRKQDAEALSSNSSLTLRHMEVLNAENTGAIFPATPRFSTKSVLN